MDSRETIAVAGAGTMGSQIALMLAAHGSTMRLYDSCDAALRDAIERIGHEAATLTAEGALPGTAEAAMARISPVHDLAQALDGVWLVIEAIPEQLDLKRSLFAELSRLAPAEAILATNSSSFQSRLLAGVTTHPQRLMNMHFYNQPWHRPGVELMTCGATDAALLERSAALLTRSGLVPFIVQGESTGFIANRIWHAIKQESLRVVAEGLATPEEVDRLWCLAMEAPIGPFALMDRVGLDVVADIERHYAAEPAHPGDGPPAFLEEMVQAGRLGCKSGQGFYEYPHPAFERPGWPKA